MEAVRYASNYKPTVDRNTPMTKDDVAHMVKMLRGLYPASPYNLDEELVITTWRESAQLREYEKTDLPVLYKRIMDKHKSFPSLSDVLTQLRDIKKGPLKKPELVDMTIYVTTGYGPTMYAGYLEGVADLNLKKGETVKNVMLVNTNLRVNDDYVYVLRANRQHKEVKPLDYAQFITLHAPSEQ
jgi:hypothetical protein